VEFKEVVGRRRSIRYFLPWRPVPREKIQIILEAARLASRAGNADFARAIVIERDKLAKADLQALTLPVNAGMMEMAPVHIYWWGDLQAFTRDMPARARQQVDMGVLNISHGWTHKFINEVAYPQVVQVFSSDPVLNAKVTGCESGLAISQALLAAVDEGLGTMLCTYPEEPARQVFGVPDHWTALWVQFVGYPAEGWEAGGQRPRPPLGELYHEGRYGAPFRGSEGVVAQLQAAKMLQDSAPLPWRREEVRAVSRMLGLPEE
jgi:nitroreductase